MSKDGIHFEHCNNIIVILGNDFITRLLRKRRIGRHRRSEIATVLVILRYSYLINDGRRVETDARRHYLPRSIR